MLQVGGFVHGLDLLQNLKSQQRDILKSAKAIL